MREDVREDVKDDVREDVREDVKMRRCEDEKVRYRPPLLEEPCAQTLSGKSETTFLPFCIFQKCDLPGAFFIFF